MGRHNMLILWFDLILGFRAESWLAQWSVGHLAPSKMCLKYFYNILKIIHPVTRIRGGSWFGGQSGTWLLFHPQAGQSGTTPRPEWLFNGKQKTLLVWFIQNFRILRNFKIKCVSKLQTLVVISS